MYPYIEIFGFKASMYAIMCIIGIGLAIFIGISRSKITGIPKNDIFYVFLLATVGLLIGGKLLYIFSVIPIIWNNRFLIFDNPQMLLVFTAGGFVFYGGIIGAVLTVLIYCKKYKLRTLTMLDTVTPGIPLAHAFGRLGCLSAGCCYGGEYNGHFAIIFPEGGSAPANISLFPSQPIEAILNFLLFILLLIPGGRKRKDGLVFGIYILSYSLIRFALEFFRGDIERGILFGLSLSQWISLALIPVALYFILKRRKPDENINPDTAST